MTDLRLFDVDHVGAARRHDPETSKAAARRQRGGWEPKIAHMFEWWGPMTDDELCVRLEPENVRKWPTIKSARSRLTHCDPPVLISTGEQRNGQMIWRHHSTFRRVRNVDIAGGVL